jgi:site-specific DNA-methyltransferase (adenine-specific)
MHKLHVGDSASVLRQLPQHSAQLVVTSPPYWSIKDYNHAEQIGLNDTYGEYLDRLNGVWQGVDHVLEPGCKAVINIGDQFLSAKEYGVYSIAPIHADIIKQFDALGGYIYLGAILWMKITNTKTSGGGTWMGSIYYPRDGYVTYEHEYILLFKKLGKARRPDKATRELSKLTKQQRTDWFRGVWRIPPVRQGKHPAMYPVEIPERIIRMFTFHGETVVDPFVGSGTTFEAAHNSGRKCVGIELNPEYADMAQARVPGVVRQP